MQYITETNAAELIQKRGIKYAMLITVRHILQKNTKCYFDQ